jgi:hypothetical protein
MPATAENTIQLEGRTIMYDVTGEGPPIVFVHGVWATGGIWYPVIDTLAERFTCVNIHLPLGVHRYPSPQAVDHSPKALARIIAGLLDALDLRDVTLVGNDTGGALCQLVVVNHPERVGRLVLTNCDAFEIFPPARLKPLYAAARVPALWWAIAQLCRSPRVQRRFFASVAHAEPDAALLDTLMKRFADDADAREDLRLTIAAIDANTTLDAAKHFAEFAGEVLVLWGADDLFFPASLGRRLAAAFARSRFELIDGARLFVSLDAPARVADAIAAFTRAPTASARP